MVDMIWKTNEFWAENRGDCEIKPQSVEGEGWQSAGQVGENFTMRCRVEEEMFGNGNFGNKGVML